MFRSGATHVQDRFGHFDNRTASDTVHQIDIALHKLRSFLAVAETLHFRRAAEQLHISQPALSRQIATLERELGVTLLTRDRRNVALTPAGRQLVEDGRILLASASATRRRVQEIAHAGRRLVIGFRAGIVPTAAIRRFSEQRPDVDVGVRRIEWEEQEQLILSGIVDVAYLRGPLTGDGLRLTALYDEQRYVALPADHWLAERHEIRLADLDSEHQLSYFEPSPSTGRRMRSAEEKLENVAAGHGYVLMPRSMAEFYTRPDVIYHHVPDAEPDRVWLATESARRSRLFTEFLEAARSIVPAGATPVADDSRQRPLRVVELADAARAPWPAGTPA